MDREGHADVSGRRVRYGRVTEADGRPVSGALVGVVSGTGPTPEIAIRTDQEGAFRIGLPRGTYRLQAMTADGRQGTVETDGDADVDIVIKLD